MCTVGMNDCETVKLSSIREQCKAVSVALIVWESENTESPFEELTLCNIEIFTLKMTHNNTEICADIQSKIQLYNKTFKNTQINKSLLEDAFAETVCQLSARTD